MNAIKIIFKIILLGLVLLAGQIAGGAIAGLLLHTPVPAMPHDGPFDMMQALVLMTVAYALTVSRFAARLRGGFAARMATIFAVLYVVGTLLSVIETIYFKAYVKLPPFLVGQMALTGLTQAVIAAPVAAALWRGAQGEPEAISGLWWRLPSIAAIYIVFYFGAGALIAWQGVELRAYYDQAMHINETHLALLQFGRGLIWATLAWMSVRSLTGGVLSRASITGLVFCVIMVMPLLFPNPYMPWAVREMHFMEIAASNFLFGLVAAGLLLTGLKRKTT